ncbi:MAG: bacteriocin fulvocin C-related protein [Vicinamibacterales bacterium]|nr:bacteriocin fulvocin C-related protein [Vicinamibacterales bacterium]
MTRTTRRWVIAFALVAIIAGVFNSVAMFASSPKLVAKMWATGLTATDRAAASRQFYALPKEFRGALLMVLTGAEKSTLARRNIQAYLASKPDLTADQQAVLQEAYDLLTPEFCSQKHAKGETDISQRLLTLLPKGDAYLFVKPGGDAVIGLQSAESPSALPVLTQARLFMAQHFVVAAEGILPGTSCDCNYGDTCISGGSGHICSELTNCVSDGWDGEHGCGLFHLFTCYAKCVENMNQ